MKGDSSGYKSLVTIYFFQHFENVTPSSFTFYYLCWEVIYQIVTPLKIVLFLRLLLRLYVFNNFVFNVFFFLISTNIIQIQFLLHCLDHKDTCLEHGHMFSSRTNSIEMCTVVDIFLY